MQHGRRRDRRPARRAGRAPVPFPSAPVVVAGARVVLVGYFSAKEKHFGALMDAAAEALSGRGARVLGRFTQRRGVSDGGVARMALPFSSRTLLRQGKVREVAEACARSGADAVVFLPSLTERQRRALTDALGCPAVGLDKVLGGG